MLAVTFTRRAAGELRHRLRRLGLREELAAGTFHAVALAMLRRHWEESGRRAPELLQSRTAFLARHEDRLDRGAVSDLAGEIGWARARLITPDRYEEAAATAGRRPPKGGAFVAGAYDRYETAKRRRRLLDFDDLLALCHATMQRDQRFAEAQRWRHRHLFVDEFQDVNPLQFALLQAWLGPDSTLVVVGDPDQAIYGWNGADPELLDEIHRHLPGTAVVHLRTNFRSTPEILSAAGRILDREPQPAVRPAGPEPDVRVLDGAQEAVEVARAVRGAHRPGAPWSHQAVLARTNAQLVPLKAALARAGVPVRTRGETALLRHPAVGDLISGWDLRAALRSHVADEDLDLTADDPGASPDAAERAAAIESFLALAHDHLALRPDGSLAGTVRLESVDAAPFRVLSFHGAAPDFVDFDPSADAPRNAYDLRWDLSAYDPERCADTAGRPMPGWLVVETDHPAARMLDVYVRHRCTAPKRPEDGRRWFLSEQRALLGALRPGEPAEFEVMMKWLRGADRAGTVVEEVLSDSPQFTAELLEVIRRGELIEYRVRVTPDPAHRGMIYGSALFRSGTHVCPVVVTGLVSEGG